jgi:hypothetical protein
VRVFVNERPLEVEAGATAVDAIARLDRELATLVRAGAAYVTDGVGRPLDGATPLKNGAILRVVRSSPRSPEPPKSA